MGKIVALAEPELDWSRGRFAAYYRGAEVPPPPELARREFAAFPFAAETGMRRHAALPAPVDLEGFLRTVVPRHVYYSSAYYERPDHPTMAEKVWLGADLIFDLDADHLKGAESLGYAAQLDLVKRQLVRLVDEFLLRDFGVDASQMAIVFSGGRGYHVHVREERFRGLSSPERRELVDYLAGTDADVSGTITEVRFTGPDGAHAKMFRKLPEPEAPGWPGRTMRGFLDLLDRWSADDPVRVVAELERLGVGPTPARQFARALAKGSAAQRVRLSRTLDGFPTKIPTPIFEAVLREAAVAMQGETDAPVTTDIHRLIRLPGSLHGGTGFRVVPIPRERVDAFEPFRDALAPGVGGGSGTVAVRLREPVDYPFDPRVNGPADAVLEIAPAAALFLILRGEAALRP